MKSVAFCTLGCKVNQYETDAMEEMFGASGYEVRDFKEAADIYIVNTCTVTNIADRKSRQMLHRAKKMNPDSLIVAVGCYVQAAEDALKNDEKIDLVVGNNKKAEIVSLVEQALANRQLHVKNESAVIDINHTGEYETLHVSHAGSHTRAYIKIQDGCNQFCSYCIIPFTRGRVRSRKAEDILEEVSGLVRGGYKEVVLTGIHISSYGMDFVHEEYNNSKGDTHLIDLIEKISEIPGICRIRLGSLEPRIITEEFAKRLSRILQICPHFHLSLQSGCKETLLRMNRKYTPEQFEESCHILRRYFDDPAITTDVIVGFPGETEEEFRECEVFLEKIGFAEMHVFKYSKRQGTRAAAMKNQVDENTKNERSACLLELNDRLHKAFLSRWKDKEAEVLLEEEMVLNGETFMTGHTKEYIRAAVKAGDAQPNDMISGRISLSLNEEYVIFKRID